MAAASFFVELGAVIAVLGLLARVAVRIGLSPVPLYLLAGLAMGRGGVVPLDATRGFIETGAQIGVVLLLLVLGVEYTAEELVGNLRRHAGVGVLDLVVNAAPGAVAGILLGWGPLATFALAGVTAVSSSGIASKILSDLGRLGNRETPAVLSVLVFEDLAMAAYLPVLAGLAAQESAVDTGVTVVLALAAVAVVVTAALRFSVPVNRVISSANDEVLLLHVLGLGLVVAGAAEALHVSAGVGAFFVGIALSGQVAEATRRVLPPLRDVFAAIFFVFFGLETDPASLLHVLGPAALLAAAGIATKGLVGWVAARRAGAGVPGRLRAGAELVARGEFSVVIAGLAVTAGLDPRLAPLATAYVVVLAVAGPVLARLADPLGRWWRRRSALAPSG